METSADLCFKSALGTECHSSLIRCCMKWLQCRIPTCSPPHSCLSWAEWHDHFLQNLLLDWREEGTLFHIIMRSGALSYNEPGTKCKQLSVREMPEPEHYFRHTVSPSHRDPQCWRLKCCSGGSQVSWPQVKPLCSPCSRPGPVPGTQVGESRTPFLPSRNQSNSKFWIMKT